MLLMGFVSQDEALCEAVLEQMKQAESWQIALFNAPKIALDVWKDSPPPLILWDAQGGALPDARAFYEHFCAAPERPWLLIVGDLPFEVQQLDSVDFLPYPVRLGKLLARLQFYKRLIEQPLDTSFLLGPWVFHPRQRLLRGINSNEEVKLTDKETMLLEYLARTKKAVAKNCLLEEVWGYSNKLDTHTLETHIYRLRRKLMEQTPKATDCFSVDQDGYCIHSEWRGI
ncbi:MAG TPA: hypothetical protein DD400_00345 [Rhodospirillaceae bacterium]|nr:hypothetical protein [Rhodospirillaceae bacterium]